MVAATPVQKRTFCERCFAPAETAIDPDSKLVILWETWVFIAMTVQWLTVTIQTCLRMKKERYVQADAITASLELSFFVDLYMRTRLGYYAYGNKIMDPPTIRRTYFHSRAIFIDLLSLTPLYVVNWIRPVQNRLDGLNVNKVIRLFKVPGQLRALENRYLKRTTELRLFKLFYYTFLLAHMFGCMWFDFASNSSRIFNTGGTVGTEFGQDAWLPPVQLALAPLNVQYFSSIFWSFGLMSASSTGELPKSTHECIFSVITMTSGFFLFAYVIGNFADIIELADGGNREFVERLSAIRLLLSHFSLPKSIEDRLKTYYCFQRFHTITQERHLERCFPPSLLTDLRLVHLKPMIAKVSFLSGMEGSVTRMLVSQFHQQLVLREEYVCKYGDEGYDMYFVFTGILDVLLPSNVRSSEDENQHRHVVDRAVPVGILGTEDLLIGQLKKVSELTAGSYFGENGLFMKSLRNAYIRASTSCILYKLSRDSLELVFERYPQWKEKVLRIANLQREQNRLARLSADEQNRHSDEASGSMLSRIDLINRRAEQMEEEMQFVRLRRMKSTKDVSAHTLKARRLVGRVIQEPVMALWTSLTVGTDAQSPIHRKWLRMNIFCSVFAAWIIPYRIAVDPMSHPSPFNETVKAVEVFCEVMFVLDIRFSWRVRECANSMELYEERYKAMHFKERLLWDVVSACPLDRMLSEFTSTSWLRLLRCVKMVNVWSYMEELNRRSVTTELNRFRGVCLIYVMAIYWAACSYLSISAHAGFVEEWNSWRPAKSLAIIKDEAPSTEVVVLRLLRGLFFGITCFVKKGKEDIHARYNCPQHIHSAHVLCRHAGHVVHDQ
jgi:CRP-like cAMP-binding protein